MKALVSTNNHVLYVDFGIGSVKILESERQNYYGISWWGSSDYPVLAHSRVEVNALHTFEDYACSEQGYLSFADKVSQDFLSCPHQIFCAHNGWVVATNTGKNRVSIYNPEKQFYKDLRENDIDWDRKGRNDLCGEHFNSVFVKDDRLYVLAHAFTRQSYVLEYSFPDCQLIQKHNITNRVGCHNIFVDATGNMLTCSSNSGELLDIKSNQVIWSGSASFLRGLAVTTEMIVVGDSEIASYKNRNTTQCGLWLIDRKSLKTLDYVPLGHYGACHDVRILDVADEAHNGIRFKNMSLFDSLLDEDMDKIDRSSKLEQLLKYRKEKLKEQKARQETACPA